MVMAQGQVMVSEGEIKRYGTFELDVLGGWERKKHFIKQ
jgi:hypothetical protein